MRKILTGTSVPLDLPANGRPGACLPIEMAAVVGTMELKIRSEREGGFMATQKQRAAARKNIKKAAKAAKRKQTLKHLPKKTRRALGQQAAKVRQSRR
jgi:hypothetical protein